MLLGYSRVSTRDQHTDSQADALAAAGVDERHLYIDTASGTLAHRPRLDACLQALREGDILVITKLDRLGRSLKNLIEIADQLQTAKVDLRVLDQGIDTTTPAGKLLFHVIGAVAEFERSLTVERTHVGLAAARARGRNGGRPTKMTPTKVAQARKMYDETGPDGKRAHTVTEIADTFGVHRQTIYRHLEHTTTPG